MKNPIRNAVAVLTFLGLFTLPMISRAGETVQSTKSQLSKGRTEAQEMCRDLTDRKEYSDCLEWRAQEEALALKRANEMCEESQIYRDGVLQKKTPDQIAACRQSQLYVAVLAGSGKRMMACGGWKARKVDRKKFEACLNKNKA